MSDNDTLQTDQVRLTVGNTTLESYLAHDGEREGRRPGVLVLPEWWGLNDYVRRRARMLAELGYTALALDVYGDGQLAENPDDAGRLMNGVMGDMQGAEDRLRAGLDYLKGHQSVDPTRTAAIGYCMGGALALHAARIGLPLAGVVSFHGDLSSFHKPAPGSVQAKILVCHGAEDSLVPEDTVVALRQEMTEADADLRFVAYPGALHGFTNPAADANGARYGLPLGYDAGADQRSWLEMRNFFNEIFG